MENAIDIDRPAETVFDYVSDMRTEADWNPAVKSVRLVSAEPVELGSRFAGTFTGLGSATMEVLELVRPSAWTTATVEAKLPFRLLGRVTPEVGGAVRLIIRIELEPTGLMAVLAPLLRIAMQRTAKANLVRIRSALAAR